MLTAEAQTLQDGVKKRDHRIEALQQARKQDIQELKQQIEESQQAKPFQWLSTLLAIILTALVTSAIFLAIPFFNSQGQVENKHKVPKDAPTGLKEPTQKGAQ